MTSHMVAGKVILFFSILYFLAVETFAIANRTNVEIRGIVINREETKLLQYAGDTTAVLSHLESAHKLFQLLACLLSCLKVNSSQTEGFWTGFLRNNEMKPLGNKWPKEPKKPLETFLPMTKNWYT